MIYHTGLTGTGMIRFMPDNVTFILLTNLGGVPVPDPRYDAVISAGFVFEIADMLGYRNLIDSTYVTSNGYRVVALDKDLAGKLIGNYKTQAGQNRKFVFEDGKLYMERGIYRNRIVPLNNGSLLMLGAINETIFDPVSGDYKVLRQKMSSTV